MHYVYLLKSAKDGSYYVGITGDLAQRLADHNRGHAKSIALKRPYIIVWQKAYNSLVEARKHEKWLKKKDRIYKDKLASMGSSPRLDQAG